VKGSEKALVGGQKELRGEERGSGEILSAAIHVAIVLLASLSLNRPADRQI